MIITSIRAAYERGRLRDAGRDAAPLVGFLTFVLFAAEARVEQAALALVVAALFLVLRWRGLGWGRGATVGALAGLVPLLTPLVLVAKGLGCAGPGCASWCAAWCASGGLVAGLVVGGVARSGSALVAGSLVAVLAGAVGCWPMGLTTVLGMVGSLLAGEAVVELGRRLVPG